jgi:hypothetical protein
MGNRTRRTDCDQQARAQPTVGQKFNPSTAQVIDRESNPNHHDAEEERLGHDGAMKGREVAVGTEQHDEQNDQ